MTKDTIYKKSIDRNTKYAAFRKWIIRHRFDLIMYGFILINLYPVLSCWYYGDDTVTRDLYAFIRYEPGVLSNQLKYSISVGRLYPLHVLQRFLVFFIFNNITKYRIFILAMNILAIFSFAAMVKVYSGSKRLFYMIMLLYPGVFLFLTRYDDAVTSYYMFIQTLVIYLSLSLIYLKKYMDNRKRRCLIFSVFLYLFSLLIYESSYLLVPVYPLTVYYLFEGSARDRIKKALHVSLPYFIAAISCFAIYVSLSIFAVSEYQGIQFSFNIRKIAVTFLKQVVASFPVVPHAYLFFNQQGEFIFDFWKTIGGITLMDIFSSIIFAFLLVLVYKRFQDKDGSHENKGFLLWLSLLLVVCPSLVISFSSKYQESLIWGLGYLPVYMTRFGLLLLFYFLFEWIISLIHCYQAKSAVKTITVGVLVILHLFSLQGNRNVLIHKNRSTYQRQIVEQSIDAGLLRGIPEDSIILLGNLWYGYSSYNRNSIYSNFCGARVRTDTFDSFIKSTYETYQKPKIYLYQDQNVYLYNYHYFEQNKGYAYSGKIDTLSMDESNITGLFAREFKLFYRGNEFEALDILVLEGKEYIQKRIPLVPGALYTEIPGLVDVLSLELVRKGSPAGR